MVVVALERRGYELKWHDKRKGACVQAQCYNESACAGVESLPLESALGVIVNIEHGVQRCVMLYKQSYACWCRVSLELTKGGIGMLCEVLKG